MAQFSLPTRAPPMRYIVLSVFVTLFVLHFLLATSSSTYSEHFSYTSVKSRLGIGSDEMPSTWYRGKVRPLGWKPVEEEGWAAGARDDGNTTSVRANATFVILARNEDLWPILGSIRSMEDRFNSRYHYPYVFLNEVPFSEEFKLHTSALASGPTTYGLIEKSQWGIPAWIDLEKAAKKIAEMSLLKIPYAWSWPYRNMCRYQSGFFWRHPLLNEYKYYWRVEPNVQYFCDLDYDPFLFMQTHNKSYSFVVTIKEYQETVASLWDTTKSFIKENPQYLAQPNLMNWLSNDKGESYNLCHFWSNFEIGSLDFWRSEAYRSYFDYLDRAGGFFYERWGDAPIHSIAAALFLRPDEIHFFQDIGYRHEPFQHCPQNAVGKCACNPGDTFENHWYSCTPSYKKLANWSPSLEAP